MSWSREQVIILIDEYRKWPNLYKVKCVNYKNRKLRKSALKSIASVLKKMKPNITETEVQQKFLALKQNAVKEQKKHNSSVKSAAESDEIYEPSLWYYDLISFVFDHVLPRESFDFLSVDVEKSDSQCYESPESNEESLNVLCPTMTSLDGEIGPKENSTRDPLSDSSGRTTPTSIPGPSKKPKTTDYGNLLKALTGNLKELTSLTAKLGESPAVPERVKSANEIFGDYVVGKLNRIDEGIRDDVEEKIILVLNAALKQCRKMKK